MGMRSGGVGRRRFARSLFSAGSRVLSSRQRVSSSPLHHHLTVEHIATENRGEAHEVAFAGRLLDFGLAGSCLVGKVSRMLHMSRVGYAGINMILCPGAYAEL